MLPSEYVLLDFETTGLKPEEGDKIIEIGAILVQNGQYVQTYQSYVNPGKEVPAFITGLTGVSTAMVQGAPTIQQLLPSFSEFIKDRVLVGHNIEQFDIPFIETETGVKINNKTIDTLSLSKELYPGISHKLKDMFDMFTRGVDKRSLAHSALGDCTMTDTIARALLV